MIRVLVCAVAALALASAAFTAVSLPHIFSDHMVLQQGQPIPVWGKAAPGEAVTVSFAGQQQKTVADATGKWLVRLNAITATADQTGQALTVTGTNTVTFQDVLVGEVWICSGQSNMRMSVSGVQNARDEIMAANYPQIRLFTVPNFAPPVPMDDCDGNWQLCAPQSVGPFSAAGYFFGRDLYNALHVPIGLVNTAWNGSNAESWVSAETLRAQFPEYIPALDSLRLPNVPDDQQIPRFLELAKQYTDAEHARYLASKAILDREQDLTTAATTAAVNFDDSAWKTIAVPGAWESNGLTDLDGILWFRLAIDVPQAWAGKEIMLHLGAISNVDNAWLNGTLIGTTGSYRAIDAGTSQTPRAYRVPGALVKAGKNVLAVRVYNAFGLGGFTSAAKQVYAELADGTDKTQLPLAGTWRYSVESALPVMPLNVNAPTVSKIYNGMISPLIPYGIRGAIWYQGESNAGRAQQYQTLLPALIGDWRAKWGEGEFPFLIVQLANHMQRLDKPSESGWAELREAQALTAATVPHTGLALAIDIGDAVSIHPLNKQEVGRRLGLVARARVYGQQVVDSGPIFARMTVQGDKAVLAFTHTEGGLVAKDGPLTGFALCGADKKYVWAQAKIDGDTVIVRADGVTAPVAVRYAWANNPACNLYNGAGLPAVPFRTDRPQ